MESVLESGHADFVGLGRPFIREPDLVNRLRAEVAQQAACTSCNICAMHDEYHSLRCWRYPRRNLAQHAAFRLGGGFRA
jgi:2,4-dienoyl-CoA reductase-like NADH-dependent reductase (Old Yellow Enzyme family)